MPARINMGVLLPLTMTVLSLTALGGCAPVRRAGQHEGAPAWYQKLPGEQNAIIGYGRAGSLQAARSQALAEIAESLKVHVQSRTEQRTISETNVRGGKTETAITGTTGVEVSTASDVALYHVTAWKTAQVGGQWFVALKYDWRPFVQKVRADLRVSRCIDPRREAYLSQTPLFRSLPRRRGCIPDLRITRGHGVWYLTDGQASVPIPATELERLYVSCRRGHVTLSGPTRELREGDHFSLRVKAARPGYVSLINLYEDGRAYLLLSNRRIHRGAGLRFPTDGEEKELVAALLKAEQPTLELYVALLTRDRLDTTRFPAAGAAVERKRETHYKLSELMELMRRHDFSSVLVRIKPR